MLPPTDGSTNTHELRSGKHELLERSRDIKCIVHDTFYPAYCIRAGHKPALSCISLCSTSCERRHAGAEDIHDWHVESMSRTKPGSSWKVWRARGRGLLSGPTNVISKYHYVLVDEIKSRTPIQRPWPRSLKRRIWYPELTSCLKLFGGFPKVREAFPLAAPTLPRALCRVLDYTTLNLSVCVEELL